MATMTAVRTASLCFSSSSTSSPSRSPCVSSLPSTSSSVHVSSLCCAVNHRPSQIRKISSVGLLLPSPSTPVLSNSSSSSSSGAAAALLSSSRSFAPLRSAFKIPKAARNRSLRGAARKAGSTTTSPRCESQGEGTDGKVPFGYTRKDVIVIGLGLLGFGVALKYGLEFFGVDSIRAGNVVQLVMVLGLTVGWISTYVFRVSSKDMTYAKQLKDYEVKVMEKRLEEMPEAELESMLAQIEEEKRVLRENRERLR